MTTTHKQIPVIFLMGPTASGKTALAMQLAAEYPIDIISVDSALIYRGMDIGTAKPTKAELAITPHRLIDIRDPAEVYSAAEFRRDALAEIESSLAKGRIPLLVGGTMMYFKALLEGLSPLPPADPVIRQEIEERAALSGWQAIHEELARVDPISAARIHPNDPQRLNRALEVYLISGKTLTELTEQKGHAFPYQVQQYAIMPSSRAILHNRIEARFHSMIEQGFEDEVKKLMARGDLHVDLPSIRCVGYRQMWQYLQQEIDHNTMVFQGVCATRQLAKRQITWLRSWESLIWLDGDDLNLAINMIRNNLNVR